MNEYEALGIILDLAGQNMLDCEEAIDNGLADQYNQQAKAMGIVLSMYHERECKDEGI